MELPLECHIRLGTAVEAIARLGLDPALTEAIVDALTGIPDGEQVIAASRAAYSLRVMLAEIIGSKIQYWQQCVGSIPSVGIPLK